MSARIRLQRFGKKNKPYYHIVIADTRAPRDGKYIERIGDYNPNTNPATINLNNDKAVEWLLKGAQPSDTAKAILSYKGAMYQKHLAVGVTKGALTEDQAAKKLTTWLEEKDAKIKAKSDSLLANRDQTLKERFAAEKAMNEERAKTIAAKNAALAAEVENAAAIAAAPEATEAPAETPVAEATEAPAETPAVEATPEAAAPAAEETPAEELKAEAAPEAPAAEETKEEPKA
jgi:small subunit ribosomal protein S16